MHPHPDNCPNCGAELPANASACPECGSDEKTGWSDQAYVGGLNLPDESFDYDEFVEEEFGKKKARPRGISRLWWTVAIFLLTLFAAALLWRFLG